MKNRELFQRDPAISKLLNDGVAAVREAASEKEIETLRYELEHFVCEGQYKDGLVVSWSPTWEASTRRLSPRPG